MIRLLSKLNGEAKRTVDATGCNKKIYATTLKTLKRDFGNLLIIAHSRRSSVFDKPQMKANGEISLRHFHQQLKCNNSWLLLMGYKSLIFPSENLTKAIRRLPIHLRSRFYKFTKYSSLMDGNVNLLIFEKWLDYQIKTCFNPLADTVDKQDLSKKSKTSLSNSYSKSTVNSLDISDEIQDEKDQGLKSNSNNIVSSSNSAEITTDLRTAEDLLVNRFQRGNTL